MASRHNRSIGRDWRGLLPANLSFFCRFLVLLVLFTSSCTLANQEPGSLLFQDDFSDPGSGWKQGQDTFGAVQVIENGLKISVLSSQKAKVTVPGLNFRDVRVEVDAVKTNGEDDNSFGLICRYQDEENFYFFQISSDAYYGIGKVSGGEARLLSGEMMQSSSAIAEGAASNHLRADCTGEELSFYVNGELLSSVVDSEFTTGDAGLIAGTISSSQVEIVFDRFMVIKP